MEQTIEFLETLRRASLCMGPSRGFQAGLKALLGVMAARHAFVRPHLVIFDPETRHLRLCVAETAPRASQVVYAPGMGVTGQVFASGKSVIVERILGHPVFLCKFFERTPEDMARLAFISVPVLASGPDSSRRHVVGVLSMDTPCAPREELELRCRFLEVVAGMISVQTAYVQEELARQQHQAVDESGHSQSDKPFVAVSKGMRAVLEQVVRAGNSRSPVLVVGEPGSGRERMAAEVHAASPRRDLPMLRFSCAGLSPEAAELELFGYRKGAFPGATQTRKGLLELARSSALFLQEVENLPAELQNRIARVMQDQEFTRVGGGQPVDVDVRLICSTAASLERLTQEGRFSADLYNRLSGLTIVIPPLRERIEDILPLARQFMTQAARVTHRSVETVSGPAEEMLLHYPWPGNIRELEICMEQAVLNCDESVLRTGHLPAMLHDPKEVQPVGRSFNDAVARFEQELLIDALQRTHGNMLQAARDLKASYRIVNYKVKKYGIDPRKYIKS